MQFETFADVWHMAGHGPFVWASYGLTLAVVIFLIWLPLRQKREFFQEQKRIKRIQAHEKSKPTSKQEI